MLIKKLWNVVWYRWEDRNVVLHRELDEELQERNMTLNMELKCEYRIGSSNPPNKHYSSST